MYTVKAAQPAKEHQWAKASLAQNQTGPVAASPALYGANGDLVSLLRRLGA